MKALIADRETRSWRNNAEFMMNARSRVRANMVAQAVKVPVASVLRRVSSCFAMRAGLIATAVD